MLPSLPDHHDLTWRNLQLGDAKRLYRLHLASARVDGDSFRHPLDYFRRRLFELDLENDTMCALDEYDHIAASAQIWYERHLEHEQRAYLSGIVHPEHRSRGLGHFLLNWMMLRGRRALSEDSERPGVLRIEVYDRGKGAKSLYAQNGFHEAFSIDEMLHPLDEMLPNDPLPEEIEVLHWEDDLADQFFSVYEQSFFERKDYPDWPQETWVTNMTAMEEFRPDLSMLLRSDDQPVGFALCAASQNDKQQRIGRVLQLGVVPAARRQRLGQALLSDLLHCFHEEGFAKVLIEMRTGDEGAQRFLEGLGFSFSRKRVTFEKRL